MSRKFRVLSASVLVLLLPHIANSNELEVNQQIRSLGSEVGYLRGPDGAEREVNYDNKGSFGLFEGDILVDPKPGDSQYEYSRSKGVVIDGHRWSDNTLYYKFDSVSSDVREMVRNAAQHIRDNTNVNIIELAASATTPYHVTIQDSDQACYSYVGKRDDVFDSQTLNVILNCGFGSTVHEFLHALGMWHEQSREDRNKYVTIHSENIQSGKEHNFNQKIDSASDVHDYDYGSIMHYGRTAFSDNGLATIESIPPGATLGQRKGMSETDINTINDMYPAPEPSADLIVVSPSIKTTVLDIEESDETGEVEKTGDESFKLSVLVRNQGDLATQPSTLTFYRSTNPTISINDRILGSDTVAALSPGDSSSKSVEFTAPTKLKNYYYGACISSDSEEAATTNNCSTGYLVSVPSDVDILDFLPTIINAALSNR